MTALGRLRWCGARTRRQSRRFLNLLALWRRVRGSADAPAELEREVIVAQALDGGRPAVDVLRGDEEAVTTVLHVLRQPAEVAGDHGYAGRQRLDDRSR